MVPGYVVDDACVADRRDAIDVAMCRRVRLVRNLVSAMSNLKVFLQRHGPSIRGTFLVNMQLGWLIVHKIISLAPGARGPGPEARWRGESYLCLTCTFKPYISP